MLPWIPTVLGVGALVALLIVAASPFSSKPEPQFGPPPQPFLPAEPLDPPVTEPAAQPLPGLSATTGASEDPTAGTTTVPASVTSTVTSTPTTRQPTPTRTTQSPPSPVTGRYRVIDSFGDGFIGEVLVGNDTDQDHDWVVRLRFPGNVGELYTSWVESAPQATLTRSGATYVWSSGVPVSAHGEALLRFHFARSGTGDKPTTCTANGVTCTGLG